MATKKKFDPNSVTFAEGEVRVERALKHARVNVRDSILTSQDRAAKKLADILKIRNVPRGIEKYQLPVVLQRAQLFISRAEPNIDVPQHSHDEGDGVRFILDGSIIYDGKELVAGDWMYIPRGKPYSFTVGDRGAVMGYCYACCCAGAADIRDFISNPADHRAER